MTNREPYHGFVQRLRKKARIKRLVDRYSGCYKDWKEMKQEERVRAYLELKANNMSAAEIAAVLRTKSGTMENFEWKYKKSKKIATMQSAKKNE